MIFRTMDATLINEVANFPDVRPFLGGGDEPLDVTLAAANPDNYLMQGHRGCFLLTPILAGVYELHTVFAKDGRGRPFFNAIEAMFRFMFAETPALEIVTKCADDNGGARWAASKVGFRERFRREDAWAPGVGVSYRVFSVDDWYVRDPECLAAGRRCRLMIHEAKIAAGCPILEHTDDEAHDRAVGAAVLMIEAGQVSKGVAFYNRWAIFAGYASIALLSESLIDVHGAIVQVRGGHVEVLRCHWQPQSSEPEPSAAA